jgi:hypothetical protein
LGDTIKAMYITVEGMESAGISTVQEELNIEDVMRRNQQNNGRNMGGTQGGGNAGRPSSTAGGGTVGGSMRIGG